jgi:hypothetical protein
MPTLVYISSVIKSPLNPMNADANTSSGFLDVHPYPLAEPHAEEPSSFPYEMVPLAHITDVLKQAFNIATVSAGEFLLDYMQQCGLFIPVHAHSLAYMHTRSPEHLCIFPLPVGLDLSTDVEVLVAAIESILGDLDISLNEVGLLLLVRRFWPNGMASDYSSRRLVKQLIVWILAEVINVLRSICVTENVAGE